MKKTLSALFVMLFSVTAIAATTTKIEPGTYTIDPTHSTIGFSIGHMVISEVEGKFDKFDGQITLAEKITDSTFKTNIETASVNTGNTKRDDHLRNADFFDATKHPKITFVSKKVTGTAGNMTVVGDLTMHGVTKEVTLKGKVNGVVKGMMGDMVAGFNATTTIKRKDFGLTWNKMIEAGPAVGEDVKVTLKIEANKKETPAKKS